MVNTARIMGLVAAVMAVTAGHASANTPGITISGMPNHVVQGTDARVSVVVRSNAHCTLNVQYSGGAAQTGMNAVLGSPSLAYRALSWTWTVPTNVQAGLA